MTEKIRSFKDLKRQETARAPLLRAYPNSKELPKFLKNYFWDTDFKEIGLKENKVYILKRILNYGDQRSVSWMFDNFKKSEIKNALSNFRGYSQKSANYWVLVLDLPRKEVLCLKKRSLGELRTFWPY